jgi:Cof subfamily protein (haloacid dehalogenase superfamily)
MNEHTERYSKLSGSERHLFDANSVKSLAETGILKIIWMDKPESIAEHQKYSADNFVGGTRAVVSSPHLLEFMNEAPSKSAGIKIIADYYGINSAEIIAMGDNYNDIDMLKYAGLGVAMGNAPEEVKQAADFVTLSNEEDGVAAAL